jgi:hypothetical protein
VRAVKMSDTIVTRHVSNPSNSNFKVPDNVALFTDDRLGDGTLRTIHSGDDVLHSLSSDTSFSASYFGVTASGGVHYDTSSHYASDFQYAFFSSKITAWTAKLDSFTDFINTAMVAAASKLPVWEMAPGVSNSASTIAAYRGFFNKFGTHVLYLTDYGFRYQLEVQQTNTSSSTSSAFEVNVSVKYLSNSVSEDLKTKNNFSDFNNQATATVSAIGGSGALATKIRNDPADASSKHDWLDDIGKRPHEEGITCVKLMAIGSVLDQSTNDSVSALALPLNVALFDLQRACVRRLVLTLDPSVVNCTLTLGDGAVFDTPPKNPNGPGFFHRMDGLAENVLQYTVRDRNMNSWPPAPEGLFAARQLPFVCTIRAGRNPKIPLTVRREQNAVIQFDINSIHISLALSKPLEFEVERYMTDTNRETIQKFQLPNSPDGINIAEQTFDLDLAASKDFWWSQ